MIVLGKTHHQITGLSNLDTFAGSTSKRSFRTRLALDMRIEFDPRTTTMVEHLRNKITMCLVVRVPRENLKTQLPRHVVHNYFFLLIWQRIL
jgi:hypothetical protein